MLHVIKNKVSLSGCRYICLLLFFSFSAYSQTVSDSVNLLKKQAASNYRKGDVYSAIYYYEKYLGKKSDDLKSINRLAELYYSIRNYPKARQYYDSLTIKSKTKYEMAWYYRGVVSMNLKDYVTAKESFTTFRKLYKGEKDPEQFRRLAGTFIEACELALTNQNINKNIDIDHPKGINQQHIESAPFPVSEDEIIFTAYIPDSLNKDSPVRQIYRAEKVEGSWQTVGEIENTVNNPLFHTGNAVISEDGKRMYFTRCRQNWQGKEICEIYLSRKKDEKWQEPEKLPYPVNDENYTSTQPALGRNAKKGGDILFFVSDRPETKGGLDIWFTEYDAGLESFKEPKNLGRNINSPGNECCPFYDLQTMTLYFSSNGKPGLGGYDIYKSTGTGTRWTNSILLEQPLNTSYDDLYFSSFNNGSEGFFTSNRPGSLTLDNGNCCDDIFYYRINECVRVKSTGKVINMTNYDVYDMLNEKYHLQLDYPEDKAPLGNIPVKLFLIDNEGKDEILVSETQTAKDGTYFFSLEKEKDYVILVKNYGFFDKRIKITSKDKDCSDTMIVTPTTINYLPEITVRINVYYEHDKSRLTPDAKATIDTTLIPVLDLFSNAVIEIGSHTDSTGTDNYNIKLSQRRSESVVKYLVEKGIPEQRLVAKGYGETVPIAPNTNPDGTDNTEGRQLNRRTELRIIGEMSSFYIDEE